VRPTTGASRKGPQNDDKLGGCVKETHKRKPRKNQGKRRRRGPSQAVRINAQVRRVLRHQYRYHPGSGPNVPDTTVGHDALRVAAVAKRATDCGQLDVAAYIRTLTGGAYSWMAPEAIEALASEVYDDDLGKALGLTDAVRTHCRAFDIPPIDMTKAELEARSKAKKAADLKAKRRANGMPPRPHPDETLKATEPWKAEGISRAQWFKRRKSKKQEERIQRWVDGLPPRKTNVAA